jgi:hypothetical protein
MSQGIKFHLKQDFPGMDDTDPCDIATRVEEYLRTNDYGLQ